jgi:flagellar biosynthesis/type III secretory pathway protein FliH
MVISNWVERKLEERRIKREQALIEMGRKEGRVEGRAEGRAEGRVEGRAEGRAEGRSEGFEQGRAYERKRFPNGAAVDGSDERQKADED